MSVRFDEPYLVRASPFVFLKRLVLVEFGFAIVPLVLIGVAQARAGYEELEVSSSISYDLLVALVLTSLQLFLIVGLFAAWYLPHYQFGPDRFVRRRGGFGGDRVLIDVTEIDRIEFKQGPLARRLNYATLHLIGRDAGQSAELRDLPDVQFVRDLLEGISEAHQSIPALPAPVPLPEMIAGGEGQFVEFKASLQWDYYQKRVNKELHEPVMKNLAGFMNTQGGYLLIGVDDSGEVLGLEADFAAMSKGNPDGFENLFNVAFNNMIGAEYRRFVEVSFPEVAGRVICLLAARPADEPVYLLSKGRESFYIRAGNASQPLTVSKAARYIQSHFGNP